MQERFENLTQFTKILKIIFTIEQQKKIDICHIVVYHVYKR